MIPSPEAARAVVRYSARCLDSTCDFSHYSTYRRGSPTALRRTKQSATRKQALKHVRTTGHEVAVRRTEVFKAVNGG